MNSYLAKIIFRIICGEGNHTSQFDEQLCLVTASTWQEALIKAKALGQSKQERFLNEQQQWVHWQFINVVELSLVDPLKDGAELYYQITEADNAEQYINLIHNKAAHLICN